MAYANSLTSFCLGDILTSDDYNVAMMLIRKFKVNYLKPSWVTLLFH